MAIHELPKDELSKHYEKQGLDVCPIKITGLDWFRLRILSKFSKYSSFDEFEEGSDVNFDSKNKTEPAKFYK
ncbi:MAG: hypothetical protein FWC91_14515 [Defluviitaleaceae bacterium]|nr:hypothetical protein [Defluviitaleaceae bacterium]